MTVKYPPYCPVHFARLEFHSDEFLHMELEYTVGAPLQDIVSLASKDEEGKLCCLWWGILVRTYVKLETFKKRKKERKMKATKNIPARAPQFLKFAQIRDLQQTEETNKPCLCLA